MPESPQFEVRGLCKNFRRARRKGEGDDDFAAVADVSFSLGRQGSLGIVGESGSGKTTLARMLVGLEVPSGGQIVLHGEPLSARPSTAERRRRARAVQIVFQDPYTSLDPRQTVASTLEEVQRQHFSRGAEERRRRSHQLLEEVGLAEQHATTLPRRLSGGQRQRVAIARALAAEPELIILDEAVSALDVSIQAQILNLLAQLRRERSLSYILISHDLAVVRQLSDEVLVMFEGRAVEQGPVDQVLSAPENPYTKRLLASVPRADGWLYRGTAESAAGGAS